MIFWNEYDSPQVIEDTALEILAQKYDIELMTTKDMDDNNVRDWFNYAIITARKNNFNFVYESCFAYYLTLYMTDEGISTGTEEKYFMKRLDKVIMNLYLSVPITIDEQQRKQVFYERLVDFFTSGTIKHHERRIFQHNIRVNNDIKQWFDKHGSVRETIIALMNGTIERPHLNANISGKENIVFLLTYSEELEWYDLSTFKDSDRLRELLY